MPRFIKSDLLDYLDCKKSAWLKRHKPGAVSWPTLTAFENLLTEDGYAVEAIAEQFIATLWPADSFKLQVEFETEDGFFARSDIVRYTGPKTIELFEVKASTSLKKKQNSNPILDTTFQTVVAQRAGYTVEKISIIHVNKEYVRTDDLNPAELLIFVDVTEAVGELHDEVIQQMSDMAEYFAIEEIDEETCQCLYKPSQGQHCASFKYFNPDVPDIPVYWLPRLSKGKLEKYVSDCTLSLSEISAESLTARQKKILEAAKKFTPQIDLNAIRSFVEGLEWPLHFYDYETVSTAIPMSAGFKPYQQIPVQYSLHILTEDGGLNHHEFLCKEIGQQNDLILHMKDSFEECGSVISWNMSFEKTCNKTLAGLYSEYEELLLNINERTVDLMDIFKEDYVDIRFEGSISIKKVLPVLCPDVAYNEDAVHEGAGAMAAFLESLSTTDINERNRLRSELREYCQLDSLAMVEIFKFLCEVAQDID